MKDEHPKLSGSEIPERSNLGFEYRPVLHRLGMEFKIVILALVQKIGKDVVKIRILRCMASLFA